MTITEIVSEMAADAVLLFDNLPGYLKEIRGLHRLSQDDFAKMIGCSRSYLSDIENGTSKPSREFLVKLSAGLKKKFVNNG